MSKIITLTKVPTICHSLFKRVFLTAFIWGVLFSFFAARPTEAQEADLQNGDFLRQKALLLQKVADGECADFNKEELSTGFLSFLRKLLADKDPSTSSFGNEVCIENAKIPPLRWRNAEIKHEVKFENCEFDDVDVSQAHFQKSLSLRESRMVSKKNAVLAGVVIDGNLDLSETHLKVLDLQNIEVGGNVILDYIEVQTINLSQANIQKSLSLRRARVSGDGARALFEGMEVDGDVDLYNVDFNEAVRVSFNGCQVGKSFSIHRAKMEGQKKDLNFENMKVGGNASYRDAVLNGIAITFSNSTVDGRADFEGASLSLPEFAREKQIIDLSSLSVSGQALFRSMHIVGPVRFDSMVVDMADFSETEFDQGAVSFLLAEIKTNFKVDHAKFLSSYPVRLDSIKVGGSALFHGSEFHGPVDFGLVDIKGNLEADEARFLSAAKGDQKSPCGKNPDSGEGSEVSFASIKVGQSANFPKAKFCRPVTFSRADIKTSLVIAGAVFYSRVDFDSAQIGGDVQADNSYFRASTVFSSIGISGMARLSSAVFWGRLDFDYAQVDGNLVVENATFCGNSDFRSSRIKGDFKADTARFKNSVNFTGIDVDGNAELQSTEFHREADFTSAQIGRDLVAEGAQFMSRARFDRLQLGGSASFSDKEGRETFRGKVSFQHAEIGRDLRAEDVTFRGQAIFDGLDLAGDADFRSVFLDVASFERAHVTGEFKAAQTRFKSKAAFSNMTVGRSFVLAPPEFKKRVTENKETTKQYNILCDEFDEARTIFNDAAEFTQAEVDQSFEADCVKFENVPKPADFSGMKVKRDATFRGAKFSGGVNFEYVEMNHVNLDGGEVHRTAELEHAKFGTLVTGNVNWRGGLKLEHIQYTHLIPSEEADEKTRWRRVLDWLGKADYSPQFYGELEESLKADGERDIADQVYVEMKRRERDEKLNNTARRLGNIFLEYLVAYGRKPYKALLWSALVVLLGVVIYIDPKDVQPRDPPAEEESRLQQFDALFLPSLKGQNHPFKPYNPLWFSLDLFLPFINLRASDTWMPRQDQFFRRNYAKIHTLLGWVLVPIGLASISGLVK